ncbi:MAG: hypothetical protein ABH829_05840 [archaeon]
MKVKRTSVIRRIARGDLDEVRRVRRKPTSGDVVKVNVSKIGFCKHFENVHGRLGMFFRNNELYCAMGTRYATAEYEAIVPGKTPKTLDLLNAGGVCGKVIGRNVMVSEPTKLEFEGYVVKGSHVVNIADYALPVLKKKKIPTIFVVGSDMDSGKTTTAGTIISSLVDGGFRVNGGKVTGVARVRDIYSMKDAGASKIADIIDAGRSSTYLLNIDELMDTFWRIHTNLAKDDPDYIVLEIADGIFEKENEMLLKNEDLRRMISKLVFAAGDAIGAQGGVRYLNEHYRLNVDAVSGIFSNSALSKRELGRKISVPIFSNLPEEEEGVVELLTK